MKKLILYNIVLLFYFMHSGDILSQNKDSISLHSIKDYYKEYKLQPRLFIQRIEKKQKTRVKEGALINCQLIDYSYTGLAYLKIITDEGIYIAPFTMKSDSIVNRKKKKKELVVLASDTIVFIHYADILNFSFRNNVEGQNDAAGLLLFLGGELIIAPLIITPIIYGSVSNVPGNLVASLVASGIPFVISGLIWKKILKKFKSYPMQLYNFVLIKKTD